MWQCLPFNLEVLPNLFICPWSFVQIVSGQRYSRKLSERQVTALLRAKCQRPSDRERVYIRWLHTIIMMVMDLSRKEFGMRKREKMTLVNARVLPPPSLKYHDSGREKFANPSMGQWNMTNKHFNVEPLVPFQSAHHGQMERVLRDIHRTSIKRLEEIGQKGRHLQLLIVILPDVSGTYGVVKRICETELGIVSQCCMPRQAAKLNKQYLENLTLKI
ncbi:hypothetical protein C1H46_001105 [Malus baccata]|uniref:Piwi domain-containing protein n=1 Tax=Malus baccata TaxID=106549 RepID=A0A540NQI2_MALBA|nr:hypothetical protein C1H46_001105 [Malus baccata]